MHTRVAAAFSRPRRQIETSRWQHVDPEQRRAMKEAKGVEIQKWISSKVCRAALGPTPPDRLMRMRWVLLLKWADGSKFVKGKARLVVIGFTDSDLGLESAGPLVLGSPGPWVPWSVLWSFGQLVLWSSGPLVLWSAGPLVLRSPGPLVSCSPTPLVPCPSGLLLQWAPKPSPLVS